MGRGIFINRTGLFLVCSWVLFSWNQLKRCEGIIDYLSDDSLIVSQGILTRKSTAARFESVNNSSVFSENFQFWINKEGIIHFAVVFGDLYWKLGSSIMKVCFELGSWMIAHKMFDKSPERDYIVLEVQVQGCCCILWGGCLWEDVWWRLATILMGFLA